MDEQKPPLTLLQDTELPEWLLRKEVAPVVEEEGDQNALGRRRRAAARSVRNYSEMEHESEFLRAVDDDAEEDEEEEGARFALSQCDSSRWHRAASDQLLISLWRRGAVHLTYIDGDPSLTAFLYRGDRGLSAAYASQEKAEMQVNVGAKRPRAKPVAGEASETPVAKRPRGADSQPSGHGDACHAIVAGFAGSRGPAASRGACAAKSLERPLMR